MGGCGSDWPCIRADCHSLRSSALLVHLFMALGNVLVLLRCRTVRRRCQQRRAEAKTLSDLGFQGKSTGKSFKLLVPTPVPTEALYAAEAVANNSPPKPRSESGLVGRRTYPLMHCLTGIPLLRKPGTSDERPCRLSSCALRSQSLHSLRARMTLTIGRTLHTHRHRRERHRHRHRHRKVQSPGSQQALLVASSTPSGHGGRS